MNREHFFYNKTLFTFSNSSTYVWYINARHGFRQKFQCTLWLSSSIIEDFEIDTNLY